MKLLDELFDFGDAALEDEVAVVGLALGDLASDGAQHQVLHFAEIRGLAQGSGQLDVGHLGQHVARRPLLSTTICRILPQKGADMEKRKERIMKPDKKLAAVCGLFCEACSLYIATREEPERLTWLAAQFHLTEEEVKCYGCRSEKRGPYCRICHMAPCAARHGIKFCSACPEYPCAELKAFQAERPHRIELWQSLEQIRDQGWERWIADMRQHYACSRCGALNSAYDPKCRKCGAEPSCGYVARHGEAVREFLSRR